MPSETHPRLVDWFLQSASRYPSRPALDLGDTVLTYDELLLRARRIAGLLRRGSPNTASERIGLCTGKSADAYAGYLGILLAGATVVPVSPDWPVTRIADILELAGCSRVLTDAANDAMALGPIEIVQAAKAARVPSYEEKHPALDSPAYILFTSGSTGRPKGVPIGDHQVAAYLSFAIDRYEVGPHSRVSQIFALTFDPSVHDMFTAWGAGAALVVPRGREAMLPARFVSQRSLTHWSSVPSIAGIARRFGRLQSGSITGLRCTVFMGDQLTLDLARDWKRASPGSRLHNAYGPTEATVTITSYELPAAITEWPRTSNGAVPIGRPNSGLDAMLAGPDDELCVRGPQVFHGYLDPSDDQDRFLDGKWYRTGDRVELTDGEFVHLGRLDRQVKRNGYRVELAEVESVVRAIAGIDEAVVTLVDDRLVAICVPAPGVAAVSEAAVAKAVGEHLPSYMVPDAVITVPGLPMSANAKVDYSGAQELARAAQRNGDR